MKQGLPFEVLFFFHLQVLITGKRHVCADVVTVQCVASSSMPALSHHGTCSRQSWCLTIVISRQIFAVLSYAVVNEGQIPSPVDYFFRLKAQNAFKMMKTERPPRKCGEPDFCG